MLLRDAHAQVGSDVGVLIVNGVIREVGRYSAIVDSAPEPAEVIQVDGLVLPGFVDGHSHLRGLDLSEQGVRDVDLESWLILLRTVTDLDPADEALVAAGDLLSTGVTTVQAIQHSFANPDDYLRQVREVAQALKDCGLRAELMIGLSDQAEYVPEPSPTFPEPERGTSASQFTGMVTAARQSCDDGLLRLGIAPVAAQWCSDDLLEKVKSVRATGARVHTHLLESAFQRHWIGEDPVSRLRRWGLLGPALSVAHGVWLAANEVVELASNNVSVVHCPSSNAGLRVGTAPVASWRRAGLRVALGMDSHPVNGKVDMLAELRAAITAASALGDPLTAREALELATVGGAAATGRWNQVGRIAPGYCADLIAADVEGGAEVVEQFVATGQARDIHEVICAGRRLVSGGRLHCAAEVEAARARSKDRVAADLTARTARQVAAGEQANELLRRLASLRRGGE